MKYEGEVTEIELLPKLVELSEDRFTGAIRFENDAIIKIVYFKTGEVLSASTNDRDDSIDEILLRSNKVSKEHIKQALARRKENETLGDALLSLGFITRKELTWARRAQVIGILRSLARWTEGSYTIVADYLPKREEGTSFHLPQLIVELLVTDEDRARIEQVMQGGEAVFETVPGGEERYRRLGLNEDADAILSRIDGFTRASDLAEGSAMDTFSVFKLLEALHVLGITRLVGTPSAGAVPMTAEEIKPQESLEVSFADSELDQPAAPDAIPPTFAERGPSLAWEPPSLELDESLDFHDEMPTQTLTPIPSPPPVGAAKSSASASDFAPRTRMATAPLSSPLPRRKSRLPLFILLGLLLAGALAFAGWKYFATDKPVAVATKPATKKPAKRAPVVPSPAVITETAATTATDTAAVPPVASISPATPSTVPPSQRAVTPARPVATPPVRQPSSADPARARYETMAREFAAESASATYAVQIAFVCETSSLTTALEQGGSDIWFVPAERGGRMCFRVLWGRYRDRASASRGIAGVPAPYRQGRPVVVTVSQIVSR